jgi:hypothetical protein
MKAVCTATAHYDAIPKSCVKRAEQVASCFCVCRHPAQWTRCQASLCLSSGRKAVITENSSVHGAHLGNAKGEDVSTKEGALAGQREAFDSRQLASMMRKTIM